MAVFLVVPLETQSVMLGLMAALSLGSAGWVLAREPQIDSLTSDSRSLPLYQIQSHAPGYPGYPRNNLRWPIGLTYAVALPDHPWRERHFAESNKFRERCVLRTISRRAKDTDRAVQIASTASKYNVHMWSALFSLLVPESDQPNVDLPRTYSRYFANFRAR